MEFAYKTLDPTPPPERVRRVVVELPESRAAALAYAISDGITWSTTPVEEELAALHYALLGKPNIYS